MKAAVTGGNGFVGAHVVAALVGRGDDVRVLVRPGADRRPLRGLPVEMVAGDLRDRASLTPLVRGADQVFHVAADYRLWARDPREVFDTNVTGTRHLLEACRAARVRRVIYTSTVATMTVPGGAGPATEAVNARLEQMIGPYKRSKLLAEQAVRAAAADVPVVIVNPTTPVGPGDWKPTPTGRMIVDFLRGRMPAYVDTGLNVVAVEDVARGHLLAAEYGRPGERYLLGGENVSLRDLWRMLAAIDGRRAPWLRVPHAVALAAAVGSELVARVRGGEPSIPLVAARMARHPMYADVGKARRDLAFIAEPARTALERAVAWFFAHGYATPRAEWRRPAAARGADA